MSIKSAFQSIFQEKRWVLLAAALGLLLWAVLLVGVFFSTQPQTGLYADNQATYFVQGLRLSGQHLYLEHDWFANTRPLHIAFTWLVAGLERLGILTPAIHVLDVLSRLVFLGSLGLLVNALFLFALPDWEGRHLFQRIGLVLSVISVYVLSLWPVYRLSAIFESLGVSSLAIAAEKFGFYYSFGGFASFRYYVEPVTFTVLILTALGLMPYRRWRWSAALLGVAALFHASYLIHTGALVGVMILYLWLTGERKQALWAAGIYGVLVLPLVVYILMRMTDSHTAAANAIIALERVPHHTQPWKWWDATDWVHSGVIAAAIALLWWKSMGVTRWALFTTSLYVGAGIALVAAGVGNPGLAILMPWRASGYLYAVSQLVLLTAGAVFIIKVLGRWPRFAVSLILFLSTALLLVGGMENLPFSVLKEEYQDTSSQVAYPFMQLIEQQTPPDSVLLTPLEDDYRLGARRAVYVDWKSHPYLGAEVLEWWQRVEFVRQFYTLDAATRQQACQTAGVDYYVVQAADRSEPEPVVISWEEWRLVPCPLP